jgi:hypothetical protein
MKPNPQDLKFVSRGHVYQVNDNTVVIDYKCMYECIPRANILGNTWRVGWHGTVLKNEQGKIFFHPD